MVAAESVAGKTRTGMFTRLIFRNPFHVGRAAIRGLLVACYVLRAACCVPRAACYVLRATCYALLVDYRSQDGVPQRLHTVAHCRPGVSLIVDLRVMPGLE